MIKKYNPTGLRLGDIIRLFDPIVYCIVYTDNDNDDEPNWEGWLQDMPWFYMDYIIGSEDWDENEPISFRENLGADHKQKTGIVLSLTAPK